MVAAVVWTVLWFFATGVGSVAIQAGFSYIGISQDKLWPIITGWVLALGWAAFSIVQFVIQLISLIQLASS